MNNSYKIAMDKIELSDELKKKIISNSSKSKKQRPIKSNPAYIRSFAGLAACLAFCFLAYHSSSDYICPTDDIPQHLLKQEEISDGTVPPFAKGKKVTDKSPDDSVIRKDTPTEASAVLGYEIMLPLESPEGYLLSDISVINTRIAEIVYRNEQDIITYRMAKASENVSNDADIYEFTEIITLNNTAVVLNGSAELYYGATWSDGTYTFSLTSKNGVKKAFMLDVISSIA